MRDSKRWRSLMMLMLGIGVFLVLSDYLHPPGTEKVSYSELVDMVQDGRVEHATLGADEITAQLQESGDRGKRTVTTSRLPGVDEGPLLDALIANNIDYSGQTENSGFFTTGLLWLAPLLLIGGLWAFAARGISKNMRGPLAFGRSRATEIDHAELTGVTFADVAGIDEAVEEMKGVVDFLRSPTKYAALGARIPKGVLLVGAPGAGKTLLARAVAGEAKVPFFSLTGSDFVEMFVGVGAARVRDLFAKAVSRAPCILFIDEIDAIGKARGKHATMGTHEEREQTLNQLLSEMDGFDPRAGVVVVAATNRPEVLDPALTRSGRFDRQIVVDRPSRVGREAILEAHARHVRMADDVDLSIVARRTPGMVGADLAKAINEAALHAAGRGANMVNHSDMVEALDRIQLGLEQRSRAMTDAEKRRVACHEAGHAIVAASLGGADPVHRVTIIPRSVSALGATLQLPADDRHLMLRSELCDRICVLLAGRVAEKLVFDEVSTGAEADLKRATELTRRMVCQFGMSEAIGPRTIGPPDDRARELDDLLDRPRPGDTRSILVDDEIDRLLDREEHRASSLLEGRGEALHALIEVLLEDETIEGHALHELLERIEKREPPAPARTAIV